MTDRRDDAGRRAFRSWVRAHHPDAGGDPGEFAAGLARWREQLSPARPGAAADVSVFRSRGGLWLVQRWWQRRRQPSRVR
jgi:hypothetical protein